METIIKKRKAIRILCVVLLACLMLAAFTSTVYATVYTATVTRVQQTYSNWCWAASAEMVGRKIAPSLNRSQYSIAAYVKGSPPPNSTASDYAIVEALNYACGTPTAVVMGVMTFNSHKTYINGGRPVAAKIKWNSGGAHVVVIDACDTSDNSLRLVDPASGCGKHWYSYDALKSGTSIQSGSNGKYTNTWIVQ